MSANEGPRYLHSEADEARREAGPEPLLRDLVAAVDLEAVEALEAFKARRSCWMIRLKACWGGSDSHLTQ